MYKFMICLLNKIFSRAPESIVMHEKVPFKIGHMFHWKVIIKTGKSQ